MVRRPGKRSAICDPYPIARLGGELSAVINRFLRKWAMRTETKLDDILVDLEKPVKVICNGIEHENKIPRNFNATMEQIYRGRSDPGKLYTAFKQYDIPAPTDK